MLAAAVIILQDLPSMQKEKYSLTRTAGETLNQGFFTVGLFRAFRLLVCIVTLHYRGCSFLQMFSGLEHFIASLLRLLQKF